MKGFRFGLYLVLGFSVMAIGSDNKPRIEDDKDIIDRANLAIVVAPASSCDWWINIADFYRSKEDNGNVVLVGLKNVCTKGPVVASKTVTDNEIEFVTKPMGYNTEISGYIITDKGDNYVAHIPAKKKLKTGDILKIKVRFAKASVPELLTAKYRCGDGDGLTKKPVEKYYSK